MFDQFLSQVEEWLACLEYVLDICFQVDPLFANFISFVSDLLRAVIMLPTTLIASAITAIEHLAVVFAGFFGADELDFVSPAAAHRQVL